MTMNWKSLLCPKRVRDMMSSGGVTPMTEGDPRSAFDQDYGRAVFSTPVRRLQDKTQVFPLESHDAVRTRLTHSMEVSSVARGISLGVTKWLLDKKEIDVQQARSIETISATCGLLHDLGNPPFGHAGEKAIQGWFEKKCEENAGFLKGLDCGNDLQKCQYREDFREFDGNAQTIRLVSRLQVLADPYGLNLTCGTLSALLKYVAASHEVCRAEHERGKPGYCASENDIICRMRSETGTGDARNPITFMVEAADDICYSVVDLEDAVKKGVLDWDALKRNLNKEPLAQKCIDQAEKYIRKGREQWESKQPEKAPDDLHAQAFRTSVITKMVPDVIKAFIEKCEEIKEGDYHGELVKDCPASGLLAACKKIGRDYVYCAEANLRLEVMGHRVIQELLDLFWDAVSKEGSNQRSDYSKKLYSLMSSNYRNVFEHSKKEVGQNGLPKKYLRLQLVTDYICGMTDTFACTLHRQLTNG